MVSSPPDAEVVIVGAGVMGLATARALARAGRDVVVCEQFEVGHERGSSHGGSRIVRLSYPGRALGAPGAGGLSALARARDRVRPRAARPARLARPPRLAVEPRRAHGVRGAVRGARRRRDRTTLPDSGRAGRAGLFQADGGIVFADLALQAFRGSAEAAGADVRERLPVDSVQEDGDGVVAGGVRARVAVVTAGAWAPALVGVDATPTRETTSYFSLDEPVPSVIDGGPGGTAGYALVAPGIGLKAGLHQSGPVADPNEQGGPDPELAERAAAWVERRFAGAGPARPNGDVPLHEEAERRVPARPHRADRRRVAVQRPRLQVRAGRRQSARRARRGSPLAEESRSGGIRRSRPVPSPRKSSPRTTAAGLPSVLPITS